MAGKIFFLPNLLSIDNRRDWRAWLKSNHLKEKEAWLVFAKRHTGKRRILYNDAVEEALCFGWIDSTVRRIDEDRYAQKFSVRNVKTPYSQANLERLRALAKKGKVIKSVLERFRKQDARRFVTPSDILREIKASRKTWENFRRFSPSYIRIRIAYIEGARDRPAEFEKRKRHFLEMTEKNKQFGFGGVEKYY
ncbi:MAG: YdeI/OmpD-associated family protein [Anaerolineales bacterium]